MENRTTELADCCRIMEFPYQLLRIGSFKDWKTNYHRSTRFHGKLQINLRLFSEAKTMENRINNECYINRFPHVLIKIPGDVYSGYAEHPWDSISFDYPAELAGSMILCKDLEEIPCWDFEMTSEITVLIRQINGLITHSQERMIADRLDLLAFQLFEELVFSRPSMRESPDYMEGKIRKIASYFQLNFIEEIDLEDIARKNGMSRSSFFRHWKRCFQESPAEYLLKLKLKEAIRLLEETDKKIQEITHLLRFQDAAYFCVVFKRTYGITPLQYRKRLFR